ncbi:hypothetical protein HDE_12338 [Halotydeus destructor]|nr:hypothetical protein HDE_12338 [Halotydeus destructor]
MGCGVAKAVQIHEPPATEASKPEEEDGDKAKSVAFEIPMEEPAVDKADEGDSLVKKHPPKRLQRLIEQSEVKLTAEDIEEKQRKAEERRLELIEEKVNKARLTQQKMEKSADESGVEETINEETEVKSEPEIKSEPTEEEVKEETA